MTPDQFPLIRSHLRNVDRFDRALQVIAAGVAVGSIRNVALNDAKYTLSNAVSEAWGKHVREPFFNRGQYELQSEAVRTLENSMLMMGVHSVQSFSKKLQRTKATGPAVEAMRAVVNEALPLADAIGDLKSKVVKGRAPSTAPSKALNPNKMVRTCPWCDRHIAVVGGKMAHHGYERPGTGWQTSSCDGIRFPPLEVSSEGLECKIATMRAMVRMTNEKLEARDDLASLNVNSGLKVVSIDRSSTDWNRAFAAYVSNLQNEIRYLEAEIPVLEKRLRNWKPTEPGLSAAAA